MPATEVKHRKNTPAKRLLQDVLDSGKAGFAISKSLAPSLNTMRTAARQFNKDHNSKIKVIENNGEIFLINVDLAKKETRETKSTCPNCGHEL